MADEELLPSAQEVLAVLAAEHSPYWDSAPSRGKVRYCSACSTSTVTTWPCRVHTLATQRTRDLSRLGMRIIRGQGELT